jgi:hypothetical protein
VLVLDTDPLMTAAWAQMLFDDVPEALLAYPKADLYLLFEPDVPWVADGTRFFGTEEKRALRRDRRGHAGAHGRDLSPDRGRLAVPRGAGGGGDRGSVAPRRAKPPRDKSGARPCWPARFVLSTFL